MLNYIMIIFISKFLHLFSILLAGGGVIGVAVIQSIYKKEGDGRASKKVKKRRKTGKNNKQGKAKSAKDY